MSADMTSIADKNTSEIRAELATSRLTCPQVFCKTKKSGSGSQRNSSASRAVEELQPQITPNPQHQDVISTSCSCHYIVVSGGQLIFILAPPSGLSSVARLQALNRLQLHMQNFLLEYPLLSSISAIAFKFPAT